MRQALVLQITAIIVSQRIFVECYLLHSRTVSQGNSQTIFLKSPFLRSSKQHSETPFSFGHLFADASADASGSYESSRNNEIKNNELSPTSNPTTFREAEVLGLRLMQEGKYEDALKVFEGGMKLPGSKSDLIRTQTLSISPVGGSAGGRTGKSVQLLDEFERQAAYYNIACANCAMGNTSLAIYNLRRSFDNGFDNYETVRVDPDLRNLSDIPEFNALMDEYDKSIFKNFKNPFTVFGKK